MEYEHRRVPQDAEGHTASVDSVAIDGDRIVSGSYDTTIKIWECEHRRVHQDARRSHYGNLVAIDGDRIVSGSEDETIKIWNKEGMPITLKGHSSRLESVAIDGDRIVSGSGDNTIKIWNIDAALKDSEKFRLLTQEAAKALSTTNNDDNDTNKCPVCLENVSNPVTCPNNHTICKNCMCTRYNTTGYHDDYINMETNRSKCPICRASISGLERLCTLSSK